MGTERDDKLHLARLTDAIAAYLAHEGRGSGGDPDHLLRQHEDLRDLLEPMLEDPAEEAPGSAPVGDEAGEERYVGDYRLTREIGRGGMGVVYEAIHVPLGRRVALKVLPAHVTLAPQQVERFRREAAAAAKLRHHAIVPIYDVGESDGTHYFSMELVDGRNLAEVSAEAPEVPIRVSRTGGHIAQVVEIVARVSDALHYAHDNDVVHRDVKPHNILIGDDGSVRLVDFGLARMHDRHSLSQSGEFVGTPHYASPEQAAGGRTPIDSRTDVFSLGIVLYELLAKVRPFEGDTSQQILEEIRTREPLPLRRVNSRIPHDLGIICHKALEKDPKDRYSTAGEFAADLRRFLRLEPIVAQPPGALSRIGKAVRRNRLRVTTAGAVALLLVSIPSVLWIDSLRMRAQDRSHLKHTRSLLTETLLALRVAQFRPGSESEYIHRLESLSRRYDEAIAHHPASAEFAQEGVSILSQLAKASSLIGDHASALSHFGEAIRRIVALTQAHPDNLRARLGHAGILHDRSLIHRNAGRWQESIEDLSTAVATYEELDGILLAPDLRKTLTVSSAKAYTSQAKLLERWPDRHEEARLALERALQQWRKLGPDVASSVEYSLSEAVARVHLGAHLANRKLPEEAESILTGALVDLDAIRRRNPQHSVARYGVALAKSRLAQVEITVGKRASAIALLREAVQIHAELATDFPRTESHRFNHTSLQRRLAETLAEDPETREAAWQITNAALAESERCCKKWPSIYSHRRTRAMLAELRARILTRRPGAQNGEAAAAYRAAAGWYRELTETEALREPSFCRLSFALHNQGYWEYRCGEIERSKATLEEAIRMERVALKLNPKNLCHANSILKIEKTLTKVQRAVDERR